MNKPLMPRARSVCSKPGCPTLVDRGACDEHRREARREPDRARGTRQQRGYDRDHELLRAHWQQRLNAGEHITCWRDHCGKPINPQHWHLGHDDHDRTITRGPECVPCNLATATRR